MIDASIAIAWAMADEDRREPAAKILAVAAQFGGVVPGHWRTETGNAMLMCLRRSRIDAAGLARVLAEFETLELEVDTAGNGQPWQQPLELALAQSLTLHDALYLELALRRGLKLASFDIALRRAAAAVGVATLP